VNPFSDRSSIPKLARATKPRTGAPHGAAARPQSGNTLSWSGTRLKQACPRKVLQIRKYQKPAFCVAAEGKKGETRARARAGGELGRRRLSPAVHLVLVLCRRVKNRKRKLGTRGRH